MLSIQHFTFVQHYVCIPLILYFPTTSSSLFKLLLLIGKTRTGFSNCQKTDVLFPNKESDYITDKIPAEILAVLAKYSQATKEVKSLIMISKYPSNCIG